MGGESYKDLVLTSVNAVSVSSVLVLPDPVRWLSRCMMPTKLRQRGAVSRLRNLDKNSIKI